MASKCWDNNQQKYVITATDKGPTYNLTLSCKDKVLRGPISISVSFKTQAYANSVTKYVVEDGLFSKTVDTGDLSSEERGSKLDYSFTCTPVPVQVLTSSGGLVHDNTTKTWSLYNFSSNPTLKRIKLNSYRVSTMNASTERLYQDPGYIEYWMCTISAANEVTLYKDSECTQAIRVLGIGDLIYRKWSYIGTAYHNFWFVNNINTEFYGFYLYVKIPSAGYNMQDALIHVYNKIDY